MAVLTVATIEEIGYNSGGSCKSCYEFENEYTTLKCMLEDGEDAE